MSTVIISYMPRRQNRRVATLAAADVLSCACIHADAISEIPWCGFVLALKFLLGPMLASVTSFISSI